jgi:hypothetical protein
MIRTHWRTPVRAVVTLTGALSLAAAAPPFDAGPVIEVPRGAAVVIDGVIGDDEWRGAATHPLPDGGRLRLHHDGTFLFIGISAASQGFPSLCAASDVVRVLHASAALGSVTYTRDGADWTTGEKEFAYGMRTADLTDAAREERRRYLAQHGWVASTFNMGDGRAREMQISLARISKTPAIALGYHANTMTGGTVVPWPATIATSDGCVNAQLVRGFVPPRLRFDPASWATLRLQ